jgi:MFS family permease
MDVDVGNGAPPPIASSAADDGARGTGSLLGSIVNDLSTLITKQVELAKQELGEMVSVRAQGAGGFAVAAVLALFVVGFLGMTIAEALDLVMPRWAAMLTVAGLFGILAAIAIVAARARLRSAPSAPELTRVSLKEDVEWAKRRLTR